MGCLWGGGSITGMLVRASRGEILFCLVLGVSLSRRCNLRSRFSPISRSQFPLAYGRVRILSAYVRRICSVRRLRRTLRCPISQ